MPVAVLRDLVARWAEHDWRATERRLAACRRFVLDDASLYWFTASGGSAAEVVHAQSAGWGAPEPSSGVPTAVIAFAHDVDLRPVAEQSHRTVRWTDVEDRGGHLAALEKPETLVADVRAFLRSLRRDGHRPPPRGWRVTVPPGSQRSESCVRAGGSGRVTGRPPPGSARPRRGRPGTRVSRCAEPP